MSHEIEADFVADSANEATQCQRCNSCRAEGGQYYCTESKSVVPPCGHCDFFQALD